MALAGATASFEARIEHVDSSRVAAETAGRRNGTAVQSRQQRRGAASNECRKAASRDRCGNGRPGHRPTPECARVMETPARDG
jgi:hypothetical protein